MPTAQEILTPLEKNHAPAFAYVKFPAGTLPAPDEKITVGRISRGLSETIRLAPVSIVGERLWFEEPVSWPGGPVDLSRTEFKIHEGLEYAIFNRRWQDSKPQI